MKRIATVLTGLFISSFAYGSYLESCEFNGDLELKNSYTLGTSKTHEDRSGVALYKINEAMDKGSHSRNACGRHIGKTVIFNVEDTVKYLGMESARVSYFYANSRGPHGVLSSTRYEIINDKAHNDAEEISDLVTWVNMMPRITIDGRPAPRPTKSSISFKATVISNGCTDAKDFRTELVKNEDGEQVLSIQKTKIDLCEVTDHEIEIDLSVDGFEFAKGSINYNGQNHTVDVNYAF